MGSETGRSEVSGWVCNWLVFVDAEARDDGSAGSPSVVASATTLLSSMFWAVQVRVVNSLDFCPASFLSPLATFTSGAYFLHNGRR